MKWKKVDNQTWKRKDESLYADEDDDGNYIVRYEDANGESIIFKSRNWLATLNYAKKISKQEGLIKTHKSVYQ